VKDMETFELLSEKVFTVSQLTMDIKYLLEGGFGDLWILGEISNFRIPTSGHFYFSLKDEDCQIKAVMFRNQNKLLNFIPKDGMMVICRGRLNVYERKGEYQLILDYMEPRGIGALQIAFEQLKEKLYREGLFDACYKKPIPLLPKKIGIVTSPTGAAIRDIMTIIRRRYANVNLLLYPVRVQGDEAPEEICAALEELNRIPSIDVIILARGGGSIEDLWAFNDERVARAIFRSNKPIISAIGHEIDYTISDFVADLRAPTPSAAAELVVKNKEDLEKLIATLIGRLKEGLLKKIEQKKNYLLNIGRRLIDPSQRINEMRLILDDLGERLYFRINQKISSHKRMLSEVQGRLFLQNPIGRIQKKRLTLSAISEEMRRKMFQSLEKVRRDFSNKVSKLDSLSPLATLERGYSITRSKSTGEVIKNSLQVEIGQPVTIILFKGSLDCQVLDRAADE